MSNLKIILNNKEEIRIEEDELEKVLFAIKRKEIVMVKQGIFNTAYFVAIIEDTQRNLSGIKELKNLFEKVKKLN